MKRCFIIFIYLISIFYLPVFSVTTHPKEIIKENEYGVPQFPNAKNLFMLTYFPGQLWWKGERDRLGGYIRFHTYSESIRAGLILTFGYVKNGYNTPELFIKHFCKFHQRQEVDIEKFISFVCTNMNIGENDSIPTDIDSLCKLAYTIILFNGQNGKEDITINHLKELVSLYHIDTINDFNINKYHFIWKDSWDID